MTSVTITEIALALGLSRMAANNRKKKHSWQPVNKTGVDAFDINTVPGLKPEERERISNYLEAQEVSRRFQAQRRRDQEIIATLQVAKDSAKLTPAIYTAPPEKPVFTSIAAEIGSAAGRKLKEEEAAAIEDVQEKKANFLAMFMTLPEKSRQAAEAKHLMVETLENFLKAGGFKGRVKEGKQCWNWKGVQKFCDAFIDGSLQMPSDVASHFTAKGKRSLVPVSLNNWRKQYDEQGLYGLADHYISNKGQTTLTIEQQEFCVSMFTEKPDASIRSLCKAMATRFKGCSLPERSAVTRFLDNWKAKHESLHLFLTNPDAWKNKFMFAFGDASENICRLNQRWESDCTPADIMCTDGRANIVGIIDVWSRRVKLLVSPTAKSSAVGMLLRRCILDWGMIEDEFRTDNGSDFTSFYIERILEFLNVEHHLCAPFTPEQKPHIERFFKTFSHAMLPLLDGYVGHNIVVRKAIESRKTFAKRLMTRGETVEINMTAADLQRFCDRWVNAMYHEETHSSLGMSPIAKFRSWTEPVKRISNEHALDVLLSPAPSNDGWRVITKKGLAVTFGAAQLRYISADFVGHEGERVRVLIDATDLGHASIFQEDGAFLCIAQDPTWIGISNEEVARHAKQRQKEQLAELRRDHKELAKRANIGDIAEEILRDREQQAAKVADLPKPSTEYSTPALEQAAIAVAERGRQTANPALTGIIELPPEVLESEARAANKAKVFNITDRAGRPRYFAGQGEIYEYLDNQNRKGLADEMEQQWLQDYEYMLNNPNKWDCKRGLMTDDPCLLNHWNRAQQAIGQ